MTQDTVSLVLFIIFVVSAFGTIGIVFWLYYLTSETQMNQRMTGFVGASSDASRQFSVATPLSSYQRYERFEGLRGRINHALAFFSTVQLQQKISSAYWPISDVEFIFIRFAVILLGLALGWIISGNIIGGIGLGLLLYFIPGMVLDQAILNRRKKFQNQLLDFLVLIRGAVMAGYSLQQALEMAVKEIPEPASEEFGRVLREIRFGFPMDQALFNLANRMQSDDLQIVVTAIILNSQVGGNLSTLLGATIDTIRERIHLFGEIRSLTSYARLVGLVITFLPFILALLIYLVNPGYFDPVKTSPITQAMFILSLLGIIIGNFFIRRIVKIRV